MAPPPTAEWGRWWRSRSTAGARRVEALWPLLDDQRAHHRQHDGTGNADLYTRMNGQPSLSLYDCRPYSGTANEACEGVGPGPYYVSVHAYSASTISLAISYQGARPVDGGVVVDAGTPRTDAGVR